MIRQDTTAQGSMSQGAAMLGNGIAASCAASSRTRPRHPGRRLLLLVVALSLLPILIGGGLYAYGWRPQTTMNKGTLIVPPVPLADAVLQGKWSLVVVGMPPEAEATSLDALRRVRASLAKEWKRTQHLAWPELPAPLGGVAAGTVVIVDPKGMAMMRYEPGADLKGIRADLERLLKYSWIG